MNRTSRWLAPACALALAAHAGTPPADIPAPLHPASNETLAATVAASGVQIYECRAGAAGFEWAFVAPDADLFDERGRPVGRHGAGPHWEAADGSRVVGTLKARADAPAAGAVPWLLLSVRPSGPQGMFSRVTSIQRVNTAGGVAPSTPCTVDTMGATARVRYTADYRLFATQPPQ
jgi:hypothetical protein